MPVVVQDRVALRFSHASAAGMVESGTASGTLPATVTVTIALSGVTISGPFNAAATGGTLSGEAGATITSSSGRRDLFSGRLAVERGGGRYAGWHGTAALSGTLDRSTRAVTLTISGSLST
jgi:hypothetical protein